MDKFLGHRVFQQVTRNHVNENARALGWACL